MKKNPFGKEGDFITAPNISRLFSEMIAIWILSFWQSLGSPKKFNLIELGAGNGEMMKVLIESFQNFPIFLKSCNFIIHDPISLHDGLVSINMTFYTNLFCRIFNLSLPLFIHYHHPYLIIIVK